MNTRFITSTLPPRGNRKPLTSADPKFKSDLRKESPEDSRLKRPLHKANMTGKNGAKHFRKRGTKS
jgi:hypothetical protein